MSTQPLVPLQPRPQQSDPDLQMIQDFLWLVRQRCTFHVYRQFGLDVAIQVMRPGRRFVVKKLNLREPKKSFAELLREVRRLYHVLP